MNLGDLTSLAEVGIGVNLTFSLFQDLREGLCTTFNRKVQSRAEAVLYKGNLYKGNRLVNAQKVKRAVTDIGTAHERLSSAMTTGALVASLAAALGLLLFLWCAARHGASEVGGVWAYYFAMSAAGPVMLSAVAQCVVYQRSNRRLRRVGEDIDRALELIAPADPTNVDDSEAGARQSAPSDGSAGMSVADRAHGPKDPVSSADHEGSRDKIRDPGHHSSRVPATSETLSQDRLSAVQASLSDRDESNDELETSTAEGQAHPSSMPALSGPQLIEPVSDELENDRGHDKTG